MIKRGATSGSGGKTFYNGWIHVFFPYLSEGQNNKFCVPYAASQPHVTFPHRQWSGRASAPFEGLEKENFPTGLSLAPVTWDYLGTNIPLEFCAGFVGAEQRADGTLAPVMSWFIRDQKLQLNE